ncbi:MAG: STAS/SEC14 domain-containing protein [Planctomycetes bacterium]|nr:STAS/SEC14 domain-containing protein [Planctomycetota bacterium]MCB9905902.1 STAS/SEC14 domain-containing protein [Planctomycetota bacterium]
MIELRPNQPEGIVEFEASGKVTGEDYDTVLVPAIELAAQRGDGIRLLAHYGPRFEGYDLGGVIGDTKLGLRHWSGFERVAVVTDVKWLRHLVAGIGFALPCPLRVFSDAELESARLFLREALGTVHLHFDDAHDRVTVQLIGKLEPSAYAGVEDDMDRWLSQRDRMRLLIDLREFDGWQGIGALHQHFGIVRDYRRIPERVAVVGDAAWQDLGARLMSQFLKAEVKYFPTAAFSDATRWVDAV